MSGHALLLRPVLWQPWHGDFAATLESCHTFYIYAGYRNLALLPILPLALFDVGMELYLSST